MHNSPYGWILVDQEIEADTIEDFIRQAIDQNITVYSSHIEDGTIYLQIKGHDNKRYTVMVQIYEDK